ncbi:MAG: type II toxin-antitoxin system VapB family antitoxin [Sphingomonas bacterium]|nr:type II toxin-antitoxin system VapB family antitoxin [Sphingomonas bacterium]
MRTTLNIDDEVIGDLRDYTELKEVSAIVRRALIEMRQREAARRIVAMGGTMPDAWAPNEGDEPPV